MTKMIYALLALSVSLSVPAMAKQSKFYDMADSYFNGYFSSNPSAATSAGFHQYDDKLEDYSKAEIDRQVEFYNTWLAKVEAFPVKGLTPDESSDRDLLMSSIKANLLELQNVKSWEKNPDHYSSGLSSSIFGLMSRNFASQDDRLKMVIAREKQAPAVFAAAKANLKNPPQIYTEIAIDQLPGIVDFFRNDVPSAFKDVKNETILHEFKESNDRVIAELIRYHSFLKNEVLPKSHGDFRLGKDNYQKKLLYEEMVDIPLEKLLQVGQANIKANQELLKKTAAEIDPKKTLPQILAEEAKDHPAPDDLLQSTRDVLGGLKDFIEKHKIVTIPQPILPIVEETPAFMRALTFASMDTPGPYENVAKEAYFNVTLPEKSWSPTQVEEHMAAFTRSIISNTAVHEAYPGHYIQFLWLKKVKSKVRKLIGCSSNAEGWAHYSEQMMLDEGYGKGDPKLKLGQLLDALLRNARFMVGIQMHTGQMTYDQAIDYFVNEGFQTRTNAEREVKRGTSDPTYLVYTLGKLQIMKLREDYKAKMGKKFSLRKFHDAFMAQGFAPIKIVRKALMGDDSPTL